MGESTCDELAAVVDHPERDACLHSLGALYAAGRLSTDELDRRIEAALAATTSAELAAVMADLSSGRNAGQDGAPGHPENSRSWSRALLRSPLRTTGTIVVLGLGGVLVAAVGQGSNLVELLVGVAVGLIGFLTHWWWCLVPGRPDTAGDTGEHSRSGGGEASGEDSGEDDDDVAVPVVAAQPAQDPARRIMGRGDGTIPTQRSGD